MQTVRASLVSLSGNVPTAQYLNAENCRMILSVQFASGSALFVLRRSCARVTGLTALGKFSLAEGLV